MVEKGRQAGAEIEITPEMVAAGARIIESQFPDGLMQGFAEDLAKNVFEGMFCVSPSVRHYSG